MTVALTGGDLTLSEVVRVARDGEEVALAPEAIGRMREARAVVERTIERGEVVYGVTTGVASRKRVTVTPEEVGEFNRLLIRSHRVGQGEDAPAEVVRAALLRMANGFASGTTGVRPELAERIVSALNDGELPGVRLLGSVGQSDLAPNADLAYGLFEEFPLAAGEGLWLVNNNAFSTGFAALAVADAERLLDALHVSGALDLEAFGANLSILHPEVPRTRPYPGLQTAVERLTELLAGSPLWEPGVARNLQDPLTFRGLPQVLGAARDALDFTSGQLAVELNAASSNPLVVVPEERVISVSNLDVVPLAAALDFLRIALAPALTASNERLTKLLQAPFSGLTDGLAARPDRYEDGLAELGNAGHALTAEARLLAQPVSFELASTTQAEGIEDRVTMSPLGARRLTEMIELGARVVAIELVVAAQAIDLRRPSKLGTGTGRAFELVRERVPFTREGATLPSDLEPVVELVRSGLT
ncbi:MAG TPA: aromatic amino acid ammonia-lyase [Gaiellaceae bacterium]|nr:aromatic amino acid ammonia-lyase [Gaiellaceae bacterium]